MVKRLITGAAFCAVSMMPGVSLLAAELNADGVSPAYDQINDVFAPGGYSVEAPDCGHKAFGPHITQRFDPGLRRHVFRFHIHRDEDDDRCRESGRQRTEIKIYGKSPGGLKGFEGQEFTYRWKFRLSAGFQPSRRFTHLHQIKAVGGPFDSMPLFTLTARKGRKGRPDRLEVRHAPEGKSTAIIQAPLGPFRGRWLAVEERITYGDTGRFFIRITDALSGALLMRYRNDAIRSWKSAARFIRPKWGIYRSLKDKENLRDEVVDFADFHLSN